MEWKYQQRWQIYFVRSQQVHGYKNYFSLHYAIALCYYYIIDHILNKNDIHFRGGLELIELKKGITVKTYISKVAEGVFTVISMFNRTDEYVLYYHSGRKTIRVFRQVYIYNCNKKYEIIKLLFFNFVQRYCV